MMTSVGWSRGRTKPSTGPRLREGIPSYTSIRGVCKEVCKHVGQSAQENWGSRLVSPHSKMRNSTDQAQQARDSHVGEGPGTAQNRSVRGVASAAGEPS